MSTLGQKIKHLREQKKLSQEELSNILHFKNRATLANWETGRTQPDFETLSNLADFFGVTTDYLLGRTNNYYDKFSHHFSPPPDFSVRATSLSYNDPTEKIKAAITSDPELAEFWEEISQREDLQLMFKQARDLTPQSIKKVIRIIKAIEDEEADE